MADTRRKDVNWTVGDATTGRTSTWAEVQVAVLMDLRDELKRLNGLLHCANFTEIPRILRKVERNTRRKKRPTLKVVRRAL